MGYKQPNIKQDGRYYLKVYVPNRAALVFERKEGRK